MLFMGYMDGPKAIHYYDEWSQMIKVSHNFHFQKGNDIFTPRSKLEVTPSMPPLAMHEGESGEENTLALGSVPSAKAKGKWRADAPEIEPVRCSAWQKTVHDYSKLNDPLPDVGARGCLCVQSHFLLNTRTSTTITLAPIMSCVNLILI